jgi:DUF1009 family protein
MTASVPESLGMIAGKGVYPRVFAESARYHGVKHLFAVAFEKETDPVIEQHVDEVAWLRIGQLQKMLDAFGASGVSQTVMVGQITPTHLFRIRPDKKMMELLGSLTERNAHSIFGAIGDELKAVGVELVPSSDYMASTMPEAGTLTRRAPTGVEQKDIQLGIEVAKTTSSLEVGQTVVIKEGTILAVEAFEGTDETIKRAGRLGGAGAVVVKVAKRGHDMRFDIPVVGEKTLKMLKKIKAGALAVEAGRTIFLERDKILAMAERMGLSVVAIDTEESS